MTTVNEVMHIIDDVDEELIFERITFKEKFTVGIISGNKYLSINSCVFEQGFELNTIQNDRIQLRNCVFNGDLAIKDCSTHEFEMWGNKINQYGTVINLEVKYLMVMWENEVAEGYHLIFRTPIIKAIVITHNK